MGGGQSDKAALACFVLWKPEGAAEMNSCVRSFFREGGCGLRPGRLDTPVLQVLAVLCELGPSSRSGLWPFLHAGFPDPTGSHPQSTFLEEGLGTSVSQAGQPGSFLVSQPPPQAPEWVPPPW